MVPDHCSWRLAGWAWWISVTGQFECSCHLQVGLTSGSPGGRLEGRRELLIFISLERRSIHARGRSLSPPSPQSQAATK